MCRIENLALSCADFQKFCEPQPPEAQTVCPGLYRDSSYLFIIYVYTSLIYILHVLVSIPVISRGYCSMEHSPSVLSNGGMLLLLQGRN